MAKKKEPTISKRMKRRAEQRRKKRLTQIAVAVVALIILVGGAWAVLGSNIMGDGSVKPELSTSISVDEAFEMYEAGDYLLDVRTQEEWDEYHIPGTTLIPLDELANRVDEVPRDQNIVVVCRSGNRSQAGRDILLDAGFTAVTSMDGGVSTWQASGYPVE